MKKLDLLFSKICLAILLSLPIVFTSCSDDDEPVNAPKIANPGIATDTVVAKGSSFAKVLKQKATTGFTQSKDGSLWVANGNTLIRINTTDLTTENVSLPDGVRVCYNSLLSS